MDISITRYARVSTQDQDLTSQIHALQAIGYDPIYQEKATGANIERPEWKACNRSLGHGDTLVVVASTPRQIPHRPRGNPRRLASQGRALSSPPEKGSIPPPPWARCSSKSPQRSPNTNVRSYPSRPKQAYKQPGPKETEWVDPHPSQTNKKPQSDDNTKRAKASQQ